MQIYRVNCPACGPVQVMARDISVTGSTYCFQCPLCSTTVSKAASQRELDLLVGHVTRRSPCGPALTMDDVIAFHELLQDERNIEAFLSLA